MSAVATLVEVGPRDGLQNEPRHIPAAGKIALIDALSACGFTRIEAASFVSPRAVPQMADGAEVMAGLTRAEGVRYAALAPNLKGYQAARAAGVDEVAVFLSASEGFSRANINASVADSLDRARPVAEAAGADGVALRAYVSCVIGCPYDGPTPPVAVARLTEALLALGAYEVSLGDTIGVGAPQTVKALLRETLRVAGPDRLAGHFHDTGGQAVRCIETALDHDVFAFDSAVAGLGGCPFAPGAPGNVDTRAVAARLEALGLPTGVDLDALAKAEVIATALRDGDPAPAAPLSDEDQDRARFEAKPKGRRRS